MICQLCGESNPDGAEVCSRCGNELLVTHRRKTGRTYHWDFWLVVLVILVFAGIFSFPNFMDESRRSPISRAKNDLRSISTALESYYVDYNCYPISSSNLSQNLYACYGSESPMSSQPTFGLLSSGFSNLTTPIAFMSALPYDPFAPVLHAPYCYYTDRASKGWILWSAGPDMKYNLTSRNIGGIYNPGNPNMVSDAALLSLTFDPTNGSTSRGDIWRISGNQPSPASTPAPALPYDPTNGVTRTGPEDIWRVKQ
jgi:predicted nucleic acid-binding Zn ribbon protein